MNNYKIKDYIDLLIKHDLLKNYVADENLLEQEIEKVSYNSKDVTKNTLFVCKGLKYRHYETRRQGYFYRCFARFHTFQFFPRWQTAS